VMGSLRNFGGQYLDISHSINYLESHDDHTMGDFIRIGLKEINEDDRIINIDEHAKLTPLQLKLNKLAALFLFTSQGAVMIHAGQEFARSKLIAKTVSAESNWGRIDHNSYNKDNETNYINFKHAQMNSELMNCYKGLVRLRKREEAFREAAPGDIRFINDSDSLFLAYEVAYQNQHFIIIMNGNMKQNRKLRLPDKNWKILVDGNEVYLNNEPGINDSSVTIPASTGFVLQKRND
jgi:pullulanase